MRFTLKNGRKVVLDQVLVRHSLSGVLEGKAELVRRHVLLRSRTDAGRLFGEAKGFISFDPPPGPLPEWQVFADLRSTEIGNGGARMSFLVCTWFDAGSPVEAVARIESQMGDIDWDKHAKFGIM